MNQRAVWLGLSLCLVASPILAQDNVMKQAQGVFKPIPLQPPTLEGNPITPPKVELGKMLYFDPRLSEGSAQQVMLTVQVSIYKQLIYKGY